MPRPSVRPLLALVLSAIVSCPSSLAFDAHLSDTAVRDAYFIGQRRDESMARYLDHYTKQLPPPKTGPYIASIRFLTPFAQLVLESSRRTGYSAQQAEDEYRHTKGDTVVVSIEIVLTASYGPFTTEPTSSHSGSPLGYRVRPLNFWKDFRVLVLDKDRALEPTHFTGDWCCLAARDGSTLSGATLYLDFPSKDFPSDSVTIEVDPPEGDPVSVNFDLSSLR